MGSPVNEKSHYKETLKRESVFQVHLKKSLGLISHCGYLWKIQAGLLFGFDCLRGSVVLNRPRLRMVHTPAWIISSHRFSNIHLEDPNLHSLEGHISNKNCSILHHCNKVWVVRHYQLLGGQLIWDILE